LFAFILGDSRLIFNQIILIIICVAQVIELLYYINKTNRELSKFILAIKYQDFSINYKKSKIGNAFDQLSDAFEEITQDYKQTKVEQEAQYHYLQNVIEHINTGIISIESQTDIRLINKSAEKLLAIEGVKNWSLVRDKQPAFYQAVKDMGNEGQRLIELKGDGDTLTLSLSVSTLSVLQKNFTLITIQDIKNEIEQKEIEAWHKLIRILTHEIMNSATPISSLTETMQSMLSDDDLSKDTINDLRFSLKTIQRRSNGMLAFIDDYRKITRVPKPKLETVDVAEIIKEVEVLTSSPLKSKNIELSIAVTENLTMRADPKLVEQVLINLVKNAEQALLENKGEGSIVIKASLIANKPTIKVIDNGPGIPSNEISEIFIPFYTTKKEGSGIGLSLSKQIMHQHGGNIRVESNETGTRFILEFQQIKN